MGYNTTDMGYATFDHVRIPRDHMLMGNAKVCRDGSYTKAKHDKLSYTTLVYTRVGIINNTAYQLAQAAVIASRFSVVREQGVGVATDRTQELAIIDYKSQQYRLLLVMAQAYALIFASKACMKDYGALQKEQLGNNHSNLPRLHALTAALKAYSTQVGFDGAEDARKCCGGFGFSDMSGLPSIINTLAPLPTLEGENYVMYQQAARYLVKGVAALKKRKPVDEVLDYLRYPHMANCGLLKAEDFLDANNQLLIFRHRASRLIHNAANLLTKAQAEDNLTYADAWNKHMLSLVQASRAHIELFVLESFTASLGLCADSATYHALTHLRDLFALTAIENPALPGAMAFVEDGFVNFEQIQIIRNTIDTLLRDLIPDIIALGDGWDFTDASLGSAIGMYDGNIYERLMAWTRQLPLNVQARQDESLHRKGYESVIKPMLRSRL